MGMLRNCLALAKPRLMVMVVVTVLLGAAAVPDPSPTGIAVMPPPPSASDDLDGVVAWSVEQGGRTLAWAVGLALGSLLVAGSAGAMNSFLERHRDAQMERTRRRPLPDGRVSPNLAATVAIGLLGVGMVLLIGTAGWLPAAVALGTWLVYIVLYTPMKPVTTWNTTVGAISGALPVGIGWTAASGPWTGWDAVPGVACFVGLFFWQYPHFMAIAWRCRDDYAAAAFQMETTVDRSGRSAGRWALLGVAVMIALGVVISCFGAAGLTLWLGPQFTPMPDGAADWEAVGGSAPASLVRWGVAYLVMGVGLVGVTIPLTRAAWHFANDRNDATAKTLMRRSLLTLPAYLAWIVLVVRVAA